MGIILTFVFTAAGGILLEKPFLVKKDDLLWPATTALISSAIPIIGSLLVFLRKEAK